MGTQVIISLKSQSFHFRMMLSKDDPWLPSLSSQRLAATAPRSTLRGIRGHPHGQVLEEKPTEICPYRMPSASVAASVARYRDMGIPATFHGVGPWATENDHSSGMGWGLPMNPLHLPAGCPGSRSSKHLRDPRSWRSSLIQEVWEC